MVRPSIPVRADINFKNLSKRRIVNFIGAMNEKGLKFSGLGITGKPIDPAFSCQAKRQSPCPAGGGVKDIKAIPVGPDHFEFFSNGASRVEDYRAVFSG